MERQEELAVGRRLLRHIDAPTTDPAAGLFRHRTLNHYFRQPPAAEKHGLLFVRPRPVRPGESEAIDLDAGLGPIAADLAALRLETYPHFSTDRVNPRINWKFAIDTFLEGYHIPHLHRKTIAPYFIGNCGTFDGAALHVRICAARTSIEGVRRLPQRARNYRPHVTQLYQLSPKTHLH